jgi:hypothetical protein
LLYILKKISFSKWRPLKSLLEAGNHKIVKLTSKMNFITEKSEYLNFIMVFGILFTILQLLDLIITFYALKTKYVRELNPLFDHDLFIPFKFLMVFFIMFVMFKIPSHDQMLAKGTMIFLIYMYIFININNLYYVFTY